ARRRIGERAHGVQIVAVDYRAARLSLERGWNRVRAKRLQRVDPYPAELAIGHQLRLFGLLQEGDAANEVIELITGPGRTIGTRQRQTARSGVLGLRGRGSGADDENCNQRSPQRFLHSAPLNELTVAVPARSHSSFLNFKSFRRLARRAWKGIRGA